MAIEISQEELWGFNILEGSVKNIQAELQRTIAARGSYLKLLEGKYDAVFDGKTGQFTPKKDGKKD